MVVRFNPHSTANAKTSANNEVDDERYYCLSTSPAPSTDQQEQHIEIL